MWDNLRADTRRLREIKSKPAPWYVLESLLFENGYQAVLLHRLAHWFKAHRIPVLGPAIARYNLFLTGVDIAPAARIGPGLRIAHGTGIVVGNAVEIGQVEPGGAQRLLDQPVDALQMGARGDLRHDAAEAAMLGELAVDDVGQDPADRLRRRLRRLDDGHRRLVAAGFDSQDAHGVF